ncbi:MAG: hypothetical protein ABI680_02385 [Chthoniobacteraceae bacterium]
MNEAEASTPAATAEPSATPSPEHKRASLREMITDAIRYWEPRRLIYNAALAIVIIGYFLAGLPDSRFTLTLNGILFLFFLAVLANACYCGAYIVDLFAQFSGFRDFWLRWRWLLLVIGIAFAAVITRFFALGFFSLDHAD